MRYFLAVIFMAGAGLVYQSSLPAPPNRGPSITQTIVVYWDSYEDLLSKLKALKTGQAFEIAHSASKTNVCPIPCTDKPGQARWSAEQAVERAAQSARWQPAIDAEVRRIRQY